MSRIKLQITKRMMNEIDKTLQHLPERYQHLKGSYADMITKMSIQKYEWYVDKAWKHDEDSFYDENGDMYFKVLMIEYAPELYACPLYLTSKDLREIAKRAADRTGKRTITIEEYMEEFLDYINI